MKKQVRRNPSKKVSKKNASLFQKKMEYLLGTLLVVLVLFVGYHYRSGLAYYLGYKSHKVASRTIFSEARNRKVLELHQGKSVGIDVSEYQGDIRWSYVDTIEEKYPVDYVFIRATVGNDREDRQFFTNWAGARSNKMIRGAYHYYRPNENSLEQAALYIKTVTLSSGDLPPVLDIEKLPREQSIANLKIGLRRWLETVEKHYGVRPIIYTGEKYYNDFLKEEFSDYLFWIANYNFYREEIQPNWLFWQFTEKGAVPGIKGPVDVNVFNGDLEQLRFTTVE